MRRILFFALLLLVLPGSFAVETWMFDSTHVVLDVSLDSQVQVVPSGAGADIEHVKTELLLFPRSTLFQEIQSFVPIGDAAHEGDALVYEWNLPQTSTLRFGVDSRIRIINDQVKITSKVPFPLMSVPEDVLAYTRPTEYIDSNSADVVSLASDLALGEDDLFEIEYKISEWIRQNINYSLDTLTEEAVQKPSWVLSHRYGVCDELTALFIALNRALGIPTRYVSGLAYTNWRDLNDFGPHAWAEVYFPGKGWVPYDVTYGQIGYVDGSHIVLRHSADSSSVSTKYEWRGRNVELETEKLDLSSAVVETSGQKGSLVDIEIKPLKERVGFGSHNLVEVTLTNRKDYYVVADVFFSHISDVLVEGDSSRSILLKPSEKKKLSWILMLPSTLDTGFSYTFPLMVSTRDGASASSEFFSTRDEPVYSRSFLKDLFSDLDEEYSVDFTLLCNTDKYTHYVNGEVAVGCSVKNTAERPQTIEVCLDTCTSVSVEPLSEEAVDFVTSFQEEGKKEFTVRASANGNVRREYLLIEVLDIPQITIENLEYPSSVGFDDVFTLSFTLKKISIPEDVTVDLQYRGESQRWRIPLLMNDRKFVVSMAGNNLRAGSNELVALVSYGDQTGKRYTSLKKLHISLDNVTVLEHLYLFLNDVTHTVENLLFS